ncbi:MAG TPA: glycosyl hydrolase 108 family protein [Pseudomonadales bacterium]|nr:glycosyl hydrolase 108 family protein [Pseudomonadales bacterium]
MGCQRMTNWERCLSFTLSQEGGWSDNPADPGGATMKGITLGTYTRWQRANGQPDPTKDALRNISDATVATIYYTWYWLPSGAGSMPWPVNLAVFDLAVNGGVGRSDQAIAEVGLNFNAIMDWRLAWYKRLDGWPIFGAGWSRRVRMLIAYAAEYKEEEDKKTMLDANCQAFKVDQNGKVVGVELGITKIENAKYEVYRVRLRDEYEAGGQTIAACTVVDANGISTGDQVRLTWPGSQPPFENSGLPGNPNNVHIITNGYTPPKLGPLALHVGGFNAPISDIVYGIGLPFNRHVSFDVVFREKSSIIVPPPVDSDLGERVADLETWAREISAEYPDGPQYD